MQARAVHDAKAAELAAQAKEMERARDAVSVANNKTKAVQATLRAEQDAHAATRTKLDELTRLYQQVRLTNSVLALPLTIAFTRCLVGSLLVLTSNTPKASSFLANGRATFKTRNTRLDIRQLSKTYAID